MLLHGAECKMGNIFRVSHILQQIIANHEKRRKYFPILHGTMCDNYFISCYRIVSSTLWEIFSEFPIFRFQQAFNNKVVTARCLVQYWEIFSSFLIFCYYFTWEFYWLKYCIHLAPVNVDLPYIYTCMF